MLWLLFWVVWCYGLGLKVACWNLCGGFRCAEEAKAGWELGGVEEEAETVAVCAEWGPEEEVGADGVAGDGVDCN